MNYGFNTQIIIIHGEKMNPMIKGKLEKKMDETFTGKEKNK